MEDIPIKSQNASLPFLPQPVSPGMTYLIDYLYMYKLFSFVETIWLRKESFNNKWSTSDMPESEWVNEITVLLEVYNIRVCTFFIKDQSFFSQGSLFSSV